jgi:peptidoglycan/LPS O-acetylase OafA/YrhL
MAGRLTDDSSVDEVGARETLRINLVRLFKGRTLARCIADGRDNIGQLRLLAALMVVLGHCNLGGGGRWPYDPIHVVLPQAQVHAIGLMFFFMISGFLITYSFLRQPKLLRYLRARFLRLWPALFVCTLTWAFLLGPALSELPLRDYFSFSRPDSPFLYVWRNARLFSLQNVLPGLFQSNPLPIQVNTPLWSIPVEAQMYLWVAAAGVLRLLRLPWLTSITVALVLSVLILWPMLRGDHPTLDWVVRGFFGAGAIACLLRERIPISTGIMAVLVLLCLLASRTTHALPFLWMAIGYFVLWFAYAPQLPSIPFRLDVSYGVYLWGWPVQQSLVHLTGVDEPLLLFAMTAPIVLTLGTLSWLCIERPALKLKDLRIFRSGAIASGA